MTENKFLVWTKYTVRRRGWLFENLDKRRLKNVGLAGFNYLFRNKRLSSWPMVLKIDLSPLCNLHCSACIHAKGSDLRLTSDQRMDLGRFSKIIAEVQKSGRTLAVSMYYLGEPFIHPDVDQMCRIARDARLNVHLSSNFSFDFSDERIASIARSGLTHLTVCVDGATQETYGLTRVGGRLRVVLDNLERLGRFKRENHLRYPNIEVQIVKFPHNLHEIPKIREVVARCGVDQVSEIIGKDSMTETGPDNGRIYTPLRQKGIPSCFWPYLGMVIKYNGDVIPCCIYRKGLQYIPSEHQGIVGNVFETSVSEVWNNEVYQEIRKFVINPGIISRKTVYKDSFCFGCEHIMK